MQDICIPAVDFLFPKNTNEESAVLIVCSKWSQAENISTATHKAVTCHRDELVRIQSFRNQQLLQEIKNRRCRRRGIHVGPWSLRRSAWLLHPFTTCCCTGASMGDESTGRSPKQNRTRYRGHLVACHWLYILAIFSSSSLLAALSLLSQTPWS